MPPPNQRANGLLITKLKGLNNLTIDFNPHPLTAIMGVNGCGKTTILHALACCYQPYTNQGNRNYKFSMFFTPNSDSRWSGSHFQLDYAHEQAPPSHPTSRIYQKASDRWSPRYSTRLRRWVRYIGIRGAVPEIEELSTYSFITLTKSTRGDETSLKIRAAASFVLNRNYSRFTNNTRRTKNLVGVQYRGIDYSAISMGSGEQRVFKILEEVFKAPQFGLILIDEIELLLHTDALKRLILKLTEIAKDKDLQIIFTTHSEVVLSMKDQINIRHIFIPNAGDAYCFKDENPRLLYALTGNQTRTLKVFVEDLLAKQIVYKVANRLGIRKDVDIGTYGPAINCFTTVAGAVLNNLDISDCLFVMDGDLYTTPTDKKNRINNVLTGTDFSIKRKKVKALRQITQLNLPQGYKPEQYFHEVISSLGQLVNQEKEEIRQAAMDIQAVNNDHHFLQDILVRLGYERNDYSSIVDLLADQPWWDAYTQPVREWLEQKKLQHNL